MLKKVLFAAGVLLSTLAQADEKVGKVLQDYVNQLHTFSADFVQTQPDEAMFALNKSSGHFQLKRPGLLRWVYTQPDPQKILVDGPNLWVHDVELDQVTVRPITDVKADLPIAWLLYDEPIEEKFSIIQSGQKGGSMWFNLTPKEATYFQSIEVAMRKGQMQEVWMYQSADNVTKVRFNNIKTNQDLAAQQFRFQAPKGVDVIGTPLP